jgi:hypothetical protein
MHVLESGRGHNALRARTTSFNACILILVGVSSTLFYFIFSSLLLKIHAGHSKFQSYSLILLSFQIPFSFF